MSSLTNKKISSTYKGLLKTADESTLSATPKAITDGDGNNSGVLLDNSGNLKVNNTVEFGNLKDAGEDITIEKFVDEADGIANNDNDTSLPTSAAVKDYVDNTITAEDLDFSGNNGTGDVDLDSEFFAITGSNGITTTALDNTLDIDGSTLQTAINTNTSNIATNVTDIATNVSDIATNAGNIATNANGISTNATNIQNNRDDIDDQEVLIQTNQANIATNVTNIATNTADITTNEANISTNTANIATNTTNIATNTGNISQNSTDIATNATNIASNDTDISALQTNVGTNTSNISTNTSNISSNTTNIGTNTSNIATNAADIATNVGNITTNATNISTNAAGVSTNATAISTNATNIATNTGSISTNATGISTNSNDIYNNIGDISTNEENINLNTIAITGKVSKQGDTMTGDLTVNANLNVGGISDTRFIKATDASGNDVLKVEKTFDDVNLYLNDNNSSNNDSKIVFQSARANNNTYIGNFNTYDDGDESHNISFNVDGSSYLSLGYNEIQGTPQLVTSYKPIFAQDGIYFGTTSVTKKLDDYEEGTFIPTLTLSGTQTSISFKEGKYTKIGDTVFVQIRIRDAVSENQFNTVVNCTNLPYTVLDTIESTFIVGSALGTNYLSSSTYAGRQYCYAADNSTLLNFRNGQLTGIAFESDGQTEVSASIIYKTS
tara:strand:- start:80 stop:2101 length:2022 start_codon:yes stop_codon:yes gene_type:complete